MFMRPVFAAAKARPARVVYAEGEDERVLRAVQVVLDEGLAQAHPGRPAGGVIDARIERAGLRLQAGRDFELVDPENDPRFREYWEPTTQLMARDGVTPEAAKAAVRRSNTLISALMLQPRRGRRDAVRPGRPLRPAPGPCAHVIGRARARRTMAAMNALMLPEHTLFITDTFVNEEPSAEELAEIALMAAAEVRRFGMPPKVAFLSHSMFGSSQRAPRRAHARGARPVRARAGRHRMRRRDARRRGAVGGPCAAASCPRARWTGEANLLVLPNLDAANILFNVLKMTGGHGVTVGPMLLGAAAGAHPHAVGHGAAGGQHDGAGGGRRGSRRGGPRSAARAVTARNRPGLSRPIIAPLRPVPLKEPPMPRPPRSSPPSAPRRPTPEVLERLIRAGVDVVRLNFSHGKAQDHIDRAALVRDSGGTGGQAGGHDGRPAGPEDPRRQVRRRQGDAGERPALRARRRSAPSRAT
jgi:phosphotransacetylase